MDLFVIFIGKKLKFFFGVKFVSASEDAIFKKKNGGKFFFRKKDQTGGGGGVRGGFGKRPYFSRDFFLTPSLNMI